MIQCTNCGEINTKNAHICVKCGIDLLEGVSGMLVADPAAAVTTSLPSSTSGMLVAASADATMPQPPPVQQPQSPLSIPGTPQRPAPLPGTPTQPPPTQSPSIPWKVIGLIGLILLLITTGSLVWFFKHQTQPSNNTYPTATATASQEKLPSLPPRIYTTQFPNKEYVGVNDGSQSFFDIRRQDSQNLRMQAIDALQKGLDPTSFWSEYLTGANSNDAEISIYRENQQIKNYPSFTLIVGIDFSSASVPEAQTPTRSALQGIYLAQKEFNDDPNNTTKMQLLLANTGDDDNPMYVSRVAEQIAGIVQQDKDKKILGIIGWQTSVRTREMLTDLHQESIKLHYNVELPMVSETASYDNLPGVSPHYFGLAAPDEQQARLAVAEILNKKYSQVIVFKDDGNLYSQNIAEDFVRDFPDCMPPSSVCIPVDFHTEHTDATTFKNTLTKALKQVRDINHLAVFFTGSTNYDMVQLQDALANFDNYPRFPIFTGDAGYVAHPASYDRWYVLAYAYHDEWSRLMGQVSPFSDEWAKPMGQVSPFSQAYDQIFNPGQHFKGYGYALPDAVSIISYDTARVVAQSVNKVLSSQSRDLQSALATITNTNPWQGVSGQIAFDNRHLVDRALIVLEVKTNIDPQTGKKSGGSFQMICLQGIFSSASNNSLQQCPA